MVLDQRGAAFNPVAIIAIQRAVDVTHLGTMNVAANHALMAASLGLMSHRHFELGDVVQCLLHLLFQVG